MSNYLGDITAGKTIWDLFNTRASATGAPITLAGTPAVSVYKNSTTESTAGVTLTVDYDSRTGMHQWAVDTSADGTFYAAGNDFRVVLTTGTVDGVSQVGVVLAHFSIANRSALRPTTADATLDVNANGEAGMDWGNVGNKTTSNALTGTTIATTQKVDVDTIKTNPVVNAGTFTFPTNATGASTTNITTATGITVSTNSDKTGYSLTQSFPTNFSSLSINASGFMTLADASLTTAKLGTFALAKTTNITGFNDIAATAIVSAGAITTLAGAVVTVTTTGTATNLTNAPTSGDFTSVMKTSLNAATPAVTVSDKTGFSLATSQTFNNTGTWTGNIVGTLSTLTNYTGNTPQTGDSFARIGAAGAGLTALGDTRIAFLDVSVLSRLASVDYSTGNIADAVDVTLSASHGSGAWSTADLTTVSAALVKIQASTYDSASVAGSVITLSNGATQTITTGGRVTA